MLCHTKLPQRSSKRMSLQKTTHTEHTKHLNTGHNGRISIAWTVQARSMSCQRVSSLWSRSSQCTWSSPWSISRSPTNRHTSESRSPSCDLSLIFADPQTTHLSHPSLNRGWLHGTVPIIHNKQLRMYIYLICQQSPSQCTLQQTRK